MPKTVRISAKVAFLRDLNNSLMYKIQEQREQIDRLLAKQWENEMVARRAEQMLKVVVENKDSEIRALLTKIEKLQNRLGRHDAQGDSNTDLVSNGSVQRAGMTGSAKGCWLGRLCHWVVEVWRETLGKESEERIPYWHHRCRI